MKESLRPRNLLDGKETVSQAMVVFHNVGLLGGAANVFEKGIRFRAMGPWPGGPEIVQWLAWQSQLARH